MPALEEASFCAHGKDAESEGRGGCDSGVPDEPAREYGGLLSPSYCLLNMVGMGRGRVHRPSLSFHQQAAPLTPLLQ